LRFFPSVIPLFIFRALSQFSFPSLFFSTVYCSHFFLPGFPLSLLCATSPKGIQLQIRDSSQDVGHARTHARTQIPAQWTYRKRNCYILGAQWPLCYRATHGVLQIDAGKDKVFPVLN